MVQGKPPSDAGRATKQYSKGLRQAAELQAAALTGALHDTSSDDEDFDADGHVSDDADDDGDEDEDEEEEEAAAVEEAEASQTAFGTDADYAAALAAAAAKPAAAAAATPAAPMSFADLGLIKPLCDGMRADVCGYEPVARSPLTFRPHPLANDSACASLKWSAPTDIQREAIPLALQGACPAVLRSCACSLPV